MGDEVDVTQANAALSAAGGGPPFLTRLAGSSALDVSGPDAATFLHGQLANDVAGLKPGETRRSLLLNHKGHAMAEAQVLRLEPQRLLLFVDDDRADWVRETLERHIVFDEVEMSVTAAALLTVQGARAGEVLGDLGGPPGAGTFAGAAENAFVWPSVRSEAGGYDVGVVGEGAEGRLVDISGRLIAAGAVEVGPRAHDLARIAALVPTAGGEAGEGVLPQEAGLTGFVSFRKGCYLGQEIMARIEARAAVRRSVVQLVLDGVPEGDDVLLGERKVGQLGTVAKMPDGGVMALAVVRNDVLDADGLSAGGVGARVERAGARMMPS